MVPAHYFEANVLWIWNGRYMYFNIPDWVLFRLPDENQMSATCCVVLNGPVQWLEYEPDDYLAQLPISCMPKAWSLKDNNVLFIVCIQYLMSRSRTKPTKWLACPVKTQISLGISPASSLSPWRNFGSLATHWAHSKDWSDWEDAGHTGHFVGFVLLWLLRYCMQTINNTLLSFKDQAFGMQEMGSWPRQ